MENYTQPKRTKEARRKNKAFYKKVSYIAILVIITIAFIYFNG